MKSNSGSALVLFVVAGLVITTPAVAAAALCFNASGLEFCIELPSAGEYYIDEATDFTGRGGECENVDLNAVTDHLADLLDDMGWSGDRYVNSHAWPEDFMDSVVEPDGLDHVYGDTAEFAIYAGHGNIALAQFGYRSPDDRCLLDWKDEARIGRNNGASTGALAYLTSCTMPEDRAGHSKLFVHRARQQFGFADSPIIPGLSSQSFFLATFTRSNKRAWLDEMEDRPGWGWVDNSPSVMTFGTSSSNAVTAMTDAHLWSRTYLAPVTHTYYIYRYRNNGTTCLGSTW